VKRRDRPAALNHTSPGDAALRFASSSGVALLQHHCAWSSGEEANDLENNLLAAQAEVFEFLQGSFAVSLLPFAFQLEGCCSFTVKVHESAGNGVCSKDVEGSNLVRTRDTAERFCFGAICCLICV